MHTKLYTTLTECTSIKATMISADILYLDLLWWLFRFNTCAPDRIGDLFRSVKENEINKFSVLLLRIWCPRPRTYLPRPRPELFFKAKAKDTKLFQGQLHDKPKSALQLNYKKKNKCSSNTTYRIWNLDLGTENTGW